MIGSGVCRGRPLVHYYVYSFKNGRYFYERTCGTEDAAKERVKTLGSNAVYLLGHTIRGAFY